MIDIINTENSDRDFSDANNDEVLESYEKKPLSIYIHIPFCVKKCAYCDFLSFPVGAACMSGYGVYREKYIEALCEELKSYSYLAETHKVRTIYIGEDLSSRCRPSPVSSAQEWCSCCWA